MFRAVPMMTALHLNAALDALRPVMAQAQQAGDGVTVLLLDGLSRQIRDAMARLPQSGEDEDEADEADCLVPAV